MLASVMSSTSSNTICVEADQVSYSYRGAQAPALSDLSLRIDKPGFYALIGKNGSGKSTLLSLISGLIRPSSGTMIVLPSLKTRSKRGSALGIVYQTPVLDPSLTIAENLQIVSRCYNTDASIDRIDTVLDKLDICDLRARRVKQLSGGQKQRADLCRALITQPSLLLMDEAGTALDPDVRRKLWSTLRAEQAANPAFHVVYTTHDMTEAAQADHCFILRDGKLITQGTPDALLSRIPSHCLSLQFANTPQATSALASFRKLPFFKENDSDGPLGRLLQQDEAQLQIYCGQSDVDAVMQHCASASTSSTLIRSSDLGDLL